MTSEVRPIGPMSRQVQRTVADALCNFWQVDLTIPAQRNVAVQIVAEERRTRECESSWETLAYLQQRDAGVMRDFVIDAEVFWGPVTAHTDLEITWDKVRQDVLETVHESLLKGGEVDTFALSYDVAGQHGIDWNTEIMPGYRELEGGPVEAPGMIINYNDSLARSVIARAQGVL